MGFIRLASDLYFAAILIISGLAKIEQPDRFATTLERHGLLPRWSITSVSRLLPWVEIVIAGVLIAGIFPLVTALLVFALFTSFLVVEGAILATKRANECGCFGVAYRQDIDGTSVATAAILVCASVLHLWIAAQGSSVSWEWRLGAVALISVAGAWIAGQMVQRRQQASGQATHVNAQNGQPDASASLASRLQQGDFLPIDLGIPLPQRSFLLFVGAACGPCIDLCRALADVNLGDWSLVTIIHTPGVGTPQAPSHALVPPEYGRHLHDPERIWFTELGIAHTPTALALVNGRLVDQRIAPSVSWFTTPPADGRERDVAIVYGEAVHAEQAVVG